MTKLLITNARLINEGEIRETDVLVEGERISKVASGIAAPEGAEVIDAAGKFLMPGMIDDQVHFREPGLTNKGDLATESAAAAAGGITSFMDMPNVNPQTTTREALATSTQMPPANRCTANYGFYFGATNHAISRRSRRCRWARLWHQGVHGRLDGRHAGGRPRVRWSCSNTRPCSWLRIARTRPMIWDERGQGAQRVRRERADERSIPRIRSADACLKSSQHGVDLARVTTRCCTYCT